MEYLQGEHFHNPARVLEFISDFGDLNVNSPTYL